MPPRTIVALAGLVFLLGLGAYFGGRAFLGEESVIATAGKTDIRMFQTPDCACCEDWAEHPDMRKHGFRVEAEVLRAPEVAETKERLGVPIHLSSCHTAVVEGYVVEGHVPPAEIRSLLDEGPDDVLGLAVPGMPPGSPGMEVPGQRERYSVLVFGENDWTQIYANY